MRTIGISCACNCRSVQAGPNEWAFVVAIGVVADGDGGATTVGLVDVVLQGDFADRFQVVQCGRNPLDHTELAERVKKP